MEKLALIISPATQLLLLSLSITFFVSLASAQTELRPGFQATPDQSISSFQPILKDPSGNFSLGFLRVNSSQLALSVLHLPSLQSIWQANPTPSPSWSDRTRLSFNGTLVLSDSRRGTLWSTTGTDPGDTVVLLNTSNLQVLRNGAVSAKEVIIVWESFDFPANTLAEGQNFSSATALVAAGGRYAMRLGGDFMALYADFSGSGATDRIYWKHKALEARADVVPGRGPIHARVDPEGFIGMYQNGTDTPVDVQAFNSFRRRVGKGFYIVRVEPDGNLKGYNWDGASWALEYQAIPDGCTLPDPCGPYGLCRPGPTCSCLNNGTESHSGQPGHCSPAPTGDLCSRGPETRQNRGDGFQVLRRTGVDLPFKELTSYITTPSLTECESSCERNCSCWGAVYNNASGFCYLVGYPIQTMLGVSDESKFGYFKVKNEVGPKAHKKMGSGARVGLVFLCVSVLVLAGAVGFVGVRAWKKHRRGNRILEEEEGVSAPGPYKNLGSDSSRSIEMGERQ